MTAATPRPPPENESAGASGEEHGVAFQDGEDIQDSEHDRAPQDGYAAADLLDDDLTPAQILLRREIPAALAAVTPPLDMFHVIEQGARDLAIHVRHGGIDYYEAEEGLLALAEARGLQTDIGQTAVEVAIFRGLRGATNGHDEPPPADDLGDYYSQADGTGEPAEPIAQAFTTPLDWPDEPPPRTSWAVHNLIPRGDVSSLGGDGGSGKTQAALQLSTAMARGAPDWLGYVLEPGPVVSLSAEEPKDEIRRRTARDGARHGFTRRDLKGLHFWFPSDFADCTFAIPGPGGVMNGTPLFRSIERAVIELRPSLVVLDNVAAVFAGNQNDRVMVRTFVNLFRGMARASGAAVLLLDHPSLSGMQSGTGRGGNMDWRNSVRSALHLRAADDKADADRGCRVLEHVKSNYAPLAAPLRLEWVDGVLAIEGTAAPHQRAAQDALADGKFLELLAQHIQLGIDVGQSEGRNYAPKVFSASPDGGGFTSRGFATVMHRLLVTGRIEIEENGPPSKRRKRLVMAGQGRTK